MNCPHCGHPTTDHYMEPDIKRFQCWERMSYDNNDFCGCTHGAPPKATLMLYAIRNSKGEFFRAKGRDGYGKKSWVPDLIDAKLYSKVSQARARVTYFANNNPQKLPVPELVEFKAVEHRIIDERVRVADAKRKKELEVERRKKEHAEWELEQAKKSLEEAQKKIERLTRGN